MLTLTQRTSSSLPAAVRLVLPFELRQKSRFRACLDTGEEVGVVLERGGVLRGGDKLLAADGRVVEIAAAPETVTTVRATDPWQLARAAYHLGNRHVSLQLGPEWLRYPQDHVLDEMVRGLGLATTTEQAPFEPEAGAYGHGQHYTALGRTHAHHHPLTPSIDR